MTLDEALEILVAHQDEQDALSEGTVFAYNQMSEAEFRWQIGWYRIEDAANTVNISTLSDSTGTVYQTLSQLSDLSNDNLALTLAQQLIDNSLTSNSEVVILFQKPSTPAVTSMLSIDL